MEEKIKNISIELESGTVYLQGVDGSIFSFNVNDINEDFKKVYNDCINVLMDNI